MTIKVEVRSFSKDEISRLLNDRNFRNRRPGHVDVLFSDMIAGRWRDNNATIGIDENGKLYDGQHRLAAELRYQERTGNQHNFVVVSGCRRANAETSIDRGLPRRLVDYLNQQGCKNVTAVASIVTTEAAARQMGKVTASCFSARGRVSQPSAIAVFARDREGFQKWANLAAQATSIRKPGLIGSVCYQIAKVATNPTDVERFLHAFNTGENLTAKDPIHILRKRILADSGHGRTLRPQLLAAMVIKAWNAWVNGEEMSKIGWIGIGPKAEDFPEISDGDGSE